MTDGEKEIQEDNCGVCRRARAKGEGFTTAVIQKSRRRSRTDMRGRCGGEGKCATFAAHAVCGM